jgi:hypothetical protein
VDARDGGIRVFIIIVIFIITSLIQWSFAAAWGFNAQRPILNAQLPGGWRKCGEAFTNGART